MVINKEATVKVTMPYKLKKNEPYMGQGMCEYFRGILNQLKLDILSSSDSTLGNMKNGREHYADEIDLAAQEELFRLELRERDRERRLLKNISRSLTAIDQSEYGYCESCGAEIGFKRLEARPTATMCFDCKSVSELKEGREGKHK